MPLDKKLKQKGFTQHHFFLNLKKSGAGFTLIELLVVISIISLIASILLIAIQDARGKARDARRVADLNQMAKAAEFYYQKIGQYPPTFSSTDPIGNYTNFLIYLRQQQIITMAPASNAIMALSFSIPIAYAAGGGPSSADPNLNYEYTTSLDNQHYRIRAKLEKTASLVQNSLTGPFQVAANGTGATACDPALLYYCVGDPGSFAPQP